MTKKHRFETAAIHAGQEVDPHTGAISQAIHPSTTFERDLDGGYERGYQYTRSGNPNRSSLETCMTELEGGAASAAFSSGMAAVSAVFQCLKPHDHVIVPDDMYYGVKVLHQTIFDRWQLAVSPVDMTNLKAVEEAINNNTRLIWAETPSNPQLKICDIAALASIAKRHGLMLGCDNTWSTPVITRPLELGADIVMHSSTKYIGGHSDVLGGIVTVKEDNDFFEELRNVQKEIGAVPSPFDSWLTLRGLQTLALRVRAHSQNAEQLVQWLIDHPKVAKVHYPSLESHPQHDIAQRQMALNGGMISFETKGDEQTAIKLTHHVETIKRATSLGGTHSLIEHRRSIEGDDSTTPPTLIRMSVGLEHILDIIEDLEQAFNKI